MKVINLFAGPGSGKSTTAAGLFNIMKLSGFNVELVTEFAKDLTWSGRYSDLENQFYILAKQEARLARLEGKVDYAITDSPLPLGLLYNHGRYRKAWFHAACIGVFNLYDNDCFFIERVKPYQKVGRNQTEQEAKLIDRETLDLLFKEDIGFTRVPGDDNAPKTLFELVIGERP